VIILSAALDLVGPSLPKSLVLLFDVIPSFLAKLTLPYIIHLIPYPVRILIFTALSTTGMLLIALTPSYTEGDGGIGWKMFGVVLASLSSGGGELTFLGLCHWYGGGALAGWGSGTGAAGLVGAGLYAGGTTIWGWGVKGTLLGSAVLPGVMLISFFLVLPLGVLKKGKRSRKLDAAPSDADEDYVTVADDVAPTAREDEGLLGAGTLSPSLLKDSTPCTHTFRANIRRARGLLIP
jgi:battenin